MCLHDCGWEMYTCPIEAITLSIAIYSIGDAKEILLILVSYIVIFTYIIFNIVNKTEAAVEAIKVDLQRN